MMISETREFLRHYSFIMSSVKGVRNKLQKGYTLDQLKNIKDPYLEKVDVNEFISTSPLFADVRYEELVYILDNIERISNYAKNDDMFVAKMTSSFLKPKAFVLWFQGETVGPEIVVNNIKRMQKFFNRL